MFYRKDHNYIFVHNPKAAGRSIRTALGYDKPQLQCPVSHVPLYAIDDHQRYFTFGFVRNPWDRLLSYYCYLCQRPDEGKDNYDRKKVIAIGFNKWLIHSRMLLFGDNHPDVHKNELMYTFQKRSQMWWLEGCSFIGKFENLEEDLNYAAKLGSFEIKNPLPVLNNSVHDNYEGYYDQHSIDFVKKYFKEEIDRFGYKYK